MIVGVDIKPVSIQRGNKFYLLRLFLPPKKKNCISMEEESTQ